MPNDVITLHAIAHELNNELSGGRIEKIYQPESDEITITIKKMRKLFTLVISANPSHPRIHISTQKKENALNAPAFCMLLRKYLIGSYIENIQIFNSDRIIKLEVISKNELKDIKRFNLMIELMGRYSNVILTTADMKIIDAIRRIHFDQSTTRYILPNLKYVLQPQNRISLFDEDSITDFFNINPQPSADEILKSISGISKETANEISLSSCPCEKLKQLLNCVYSESFLPCLRYENGILKDYYVLPYQTLNGEYELTTNLNSALDKFYLLYDGNERKKASTKTITTILKRLQAKTERRIVDNKQKLEETKKMVKYKKYGELLLANIYKIEPNLSSVICYDYYDDCNVEITIDPKFSPADNAQLYFKKYSKLKRAAEIASQQLELLEEQREYLKTIEISIENCTLKSEYDEILAELNSLSGLRQYAKKQTLKEQKSKPINFTINGNNVYLGKNNLQNNEVTFNIANSNDLWLHVKSHHGAHVIIKGNPDNDTIEKCASIAAFYSTAKNSDKVEVDYTKRKYVKKISGSLPGMVTYTNYHSILVIPQDYKEISDK